MGVLPWGKKKTEEIAAELDLEKEEGGGALVVQEENPPPRKSTAIAPIRKSTAVAPVRPKNDIVIHRGQAGGAIVQVRSKEVTIAGVTRKVDPYQLIRMIKRVTQNIGEYKMCDDVYSSVIIGALRKGRGDLVSILENEFGIHWQINQDTGESTFYM